MPEGVVKVITEKMAGKPGNRIPGIRT